MAGPSENLVTLWAAEWFQLSSVCFLLCLFKTVDWPNALSHLAQLWIISSVFNSPDWKFCHNLSSWMFSHLHGFFHVSSNCWTGFKLCHTLNSWMDSFMYLQMTWLNALSLFEQLNGFSSVCSTNFVLFHGSLKCLNDWKPCHTFCIWMVSHQVWIL